MATVNSLLFLLSTLAPYAERHENSPVTYPSSEWNSRSFLQESSTTEDSSRLYQDENRCQFIDFNGLKYSQDKCGPGEHYESCSPVCFESCCPFDCSFDCCMELCVCDEGLVRNPDGLCIPKEECPSNCSASAEVQSKDPLHWFPEMTCPSLERYTLRAHCQRRCEKSWLPCPGWSVPGCECIPPLVRAPDGKCVSEQDCPKSLNVLKEAKSDDECGPDEKLSYYAHCGKNCSNYDKDFRCPIYRVKGCVCKEPKVRGPDGSCILSDDCPKPLNFDTPTMNDVARVLKQGESEDECGPDEKLSYYAHCGKNCTNYDKDFRCPIYRVKGCVCKEPNVRGPDGTCILPENCPQSAPSESGLSGMCHGKNEVWVFCPALHEATCDNYKDELDGPKICLPFPKCNCKPGFVRGPNGECIKPEDCPKREKGPEDCSDTEIYNACGTACEKNCTTYNLDQVCPDEKCVSGCFCKPGYVRGPSGKCILVLACWTLAPQSVGYKNTPSMRHSGPFDDFIDDIWGEDYPDEDNLVVETSCLENEEFQECGTACPRNCYNYDKIIPCPYNCVSGCFCKDPMIRGPNGKCIYKEQCRDIEVTLGSKGGICPDDEVYLFCGSPCQKNCSNYDKPTPCIEMCAQGCFCIENMVRGPGRRCILPENCPSEPRSEISLVSQFLPDLPTLKCKENEELTLCTSVCPDNCNNYDTDRLCKRICLPGCKCKNGYVKGDDGICIKKEQCKKQTQDDCTDLEYYDKCGSYCEEDCYNRNLPKQQCGDGRCKEGCFCKSGYVRSSDWKCILPQNCTIP